MNSTRSWQSYALILVLFFGTMTTSWAAETPGPKAPHFTPLATVMKAGFVPTLARGVGQYWMSLVDLVLAHENLVNHLIQLPDSEKAVLLEQVKATAHLQNQPLTKRYKELIRLTLEDEEMWMELVSEFKTQELSNLALEILPRIAGRLSPDLRARMLKVITQNYSSLSKHRSPHMTFTLAPKRMADVYIKHLLRGNELMEELMEQGKTPEEAFVRFVAAVQAYVGTEGRYSGEQVLSMLRIMQTQMREGHASNYGQVLFVGGSLTNGKAVKETSDVDLHLAQEMHSNQLENIEKALKEFVYSQGHLPRCELALQRVVERDHVHFFGREQTAAFQVSAEKIELIIYDSEGGTKAFAL